MLPGHTHSNVCLISLCALFVCARADGAAWPASTILIIGGAVGAGILLMIFGLVSWYRFKHGGAKVDVEEGQKPSPVLMEVDGHLASCMRHQHGQHATGASGETSTGS